MLFVICDTYSVNCKRPTKKGGLLATVVCCDHLRSPQILYVCFNENLKNKLLESESESESIEIPLLGKPSKQRVLTV